MKVELVGQKENPNRKLDCVFKLKIFKNALVVDRVDEAGDDVQEVIDLDLSDDKAPLLVQILDDDSTEDDLG